MKRGFTTGIQTPNRSRCSENTSTLLHPGSFALNRRLESHVHNFLGLQRHAAGGLHTAEDNNDCRVLANLRQAVKERRRGMLTRGPQLMHGNAPANMARVAQTIVKDIGFEQLSYPPYSPDLTPSDFYLFRLLKQHLRGMRFFDDDKL